jgi:MinD-like ATPase involved in chromosome partitioning or flagellar assembly
VSRRKDGSSRQDELEELTSAITAPRLANMPGSHHVVVASPKGGTGKTTTAAMLATTLATWRGEIVSVLDATNQIGTLRRRLIPSSEPPTLHFQELCQRALAGDLAPEWSALTSYVDIVGGLRVLRSLSSPADEEDLSPEGFVAGVELLRRAGQIVVSDIGTKANGPLAVAALASANSLVLATELTYDALELTIEMVSALAGQPLSYRPDPDDWSAVSDGRFASLVSSAVVVVSPGRQRRNGADDDPNLSMMLEWLRVVCGGSVVVVGHDAHLSAGHLIDLAQLDSDTVLAYSCVAAAVAARFALAEVQ